MKIRTSFVGTMAFATAVAMLTGCTPKNDAIAKAEKGEERAPGITETKATRPSVVPQGGDAGGRSGASLRRWPRNKINNDNNQL
jgi:hypothetical protein